MGAKTDANRHQHEQIIKAMHRLEQIAMLRIIKPWLIPDILFRFTALGREDRENKAIFTRFTNQVIQRRKQCLLEKKELEDCLQEKGSKKRAIFMDLLIASSEGGTLLSDEDILGEVNTFMMAGQNTTQLAMNYCLYLLGAHPEIQAKAYDELYDIFGDSDRQPTMEDLKNMKYLENCIKDALRLFPSVPLIGRTLTEDEEFGKNLLPKGSDVAILPYVLHRNPTQFPDPETFNPDNFLPEAVKKRHPYAYIPFSAGPRNCIGQRFAMLAEKTVLSTVLRQYKVKSLQTREELMVVPNIVLVPKNGIQLKLIARHF